MDHPMNGHAQQYHASMGAMPMAQPYGYGPAQGYSPNAAGYHAVAAPHHAPQNSSLFNDRFVKGLLIGAAAAYLLTNETVQRNAIKGVVKVWSLLQGGVEEIKERFQDAEAEIRAEEGQ